MKRVRQKHQPIYLTKFKKCEKENATGEIRDRTEKEGVEYDLLLFQESLDYLPDEQEHIFMPTRQPLSDKNTGFANIIKPGVG